MNPTVPIAEPARTPAPPELIERAEELVRKYDIQCFWFRHPEARVMYLDDVDLVIQRLREYGNHAAWNDSQKLRKMR